MISFDLDNYTLVTYAIFKQKNINQLLLLLLFIYVCPGDLFTHAKVLAPCLFAQNRNSSQFFGLAVVYTVFVLMYDSVICYDVIQC